MLANVLTSTVSTKDLLHATNANHTSVLIKMEFVPTVIPTVFCHFPLDVENVLKVTLSLWMDFASNYL